MLWTWFLKPLSLSWTFSISISSFWLFTFLARILQLLGSLYSSLGFWFLFFSFSRITHPLPCLRFHLLNTSSENSPYGNILHSHSGVCALHFLLISFENMSRFSLAMLNMVIYNSDHCIHLFFVFSLGLCFLGISDLWPLKTWGLFWFCTDSHYLLLFWISSFTFLPCLSKFVDCLCFLQFC